MHVEWKRSAHDRLADIYVTADPADRDAIVRAAERVNAQLADDPWGLGESRETGNHRVWFAPPLVVGFWLVRGQPRVVVTHVARLRTPPPG